MSGRDLRKFVNFHRTAIGAAGMIKSKKHSLRQQIAYIFILIWDNFFCVTLPVNIIVQNS